MSLDYIKKLEDPYYLPSIHEVVFEVNKNQLWSLLKRSNVWYEIVTQDLIQWLISHLSVYKTSKDKIKILELGAWQGKLAHFLKQSLSDLYDNLFEIRAVDNNNELSWENQLPIVEDIDMNDVVSSYEPNIIISSWLASHPDNILLKWFMGKFLSDGLSSDVLFSMNKLYMETSDGFDITHYRRTFPSVKEYILIWPISGCWSLEKTHWYKYWVFWESPYIPVDIPIWTKDWFVKNKLDIPTISILDCHSGFGNILKKSKVYSFKKKAI